MSMMGSLGMLVPSVRQESNSQQKMHTQSQEHSREEDEPGEGRGVAAGPGWPRRASLEYVHQQMQASAKCQPAGWQSTTRP